MVKKILLTLLVFTILFFSYTFCYAETENTHSQMNLGSKFTETMNKVENTTSDMKNKMTEGMENMKDDVMNGAEDIKDKAENMMNDDRMIDDTKTNYDAQRTSSEQPVMNNNMSWTTWMWIVLIMIGIVILATVWFYAMQNSDRD